MQVQDPAPGLVRRNMRVVSRVFYADDRELIFLVRVEKTKKRHHK